MVVRMSNNMISQSYLSGLNRALYKQTKAMEQLYTECKLNRPSDNPVDTVLDMRYKVSLCTNEQYEKNTDTALSWMNTTHDCMTELNGILQRVQELVISVAKPNPDMAYEAVAAEIDNLIQQALQIGNTTLGDRYIFAGQSDRGGAPFIYDATTPPPSVSYGGDDYKISIVANPGSVNPSLDGVNVTGNELFGNGKFFDDLIKISEALKDPSTVGAADPVQFLSETALGLLADDLDALLTTQSYVSAKVSMYELSKSILESVNIRINDNISKVEDVDIGEASIAFTLAQNCYNAALAVGSKLLPMSLVDFLR